jgi:hypothetical protein
MRPGVLSTFYIRNVPTLVNLVQSCVRTASLSLHLSVTGVVFCVGSTTASASGSCTATSNRVRHLAWDGTLPPPGQAGVADSPTSDVLDVRLQTPPSTTTHVPPLGAAAAPRPDSTRRGRVCNLRPSSAPLQHRQPPTSDAPAVALAHADLSTTARLIVRLATPPSPASPSTETFGFFVREGRERVPPSSNLRRERTPSHGAVSKARCANSKGGGVHLVRRFFSRRQSSAASWRELACHQCRERQRTRVLRLASPSKLLAPGNS